MVDEMKILYRPSNKMERVLCSFETMSDKTYGNWPLPCMKMLHITVNLKCVYYPYYWGKETMQILPQFWPLSLPRAGKKGERKKNTEARSDGWSDGKLLFIITGLTTNRQIKKKNNNTKKPIRRPNTKNCAVKGWQYLSRFKIDKYVWVFREHTRGEMRARVRILVYNSCCCLVRT